MLSIDTNLLFYAFARDRPEHPSAWDWILSVGEREDVAISEFVLVEFYRLLRNPSVMARPLGAEDAAATVSAYRHHPKWRLIGFTPRSQKLHDELFGLLAKPGIAYRRIYDIRLALTLRQHGVEEFATSNARDFQGLGIRRVWDPLETSR